VIDRIRTLLVDISLWITHPRVMYLYHFKKNQSLSRSDMKLVIWHIIESPRAMDMWERRQGIELTKMTLPPGIKTDGYD